MCLPGKLFSGLFGPVYNRRTRNRLIYDTPISIGGQSVFRMDTGSKFMPGLSWLADPFARKQPDIDNRGNRGSVGKTGIRAIEAGSDKGADIKDGRQRRYKKSV